MANHIFQLETALHNIPDLTYAEGKIINKLQNTLGKSAEEVRQILGAFSSRFRLGYQCPYKS
jgi:hypothetical protein